jgi:hypothetical protein
MNAEPDPTEFALWHRPTRRHKWRVVGHADTGAGAYALIDSTDHHGGHWIVTPRGRSPD